MALVRRALVAAGVLRLLQEAAMTSAWTATRAVLNEHQLQNVQRDPVVAGLKKFTRHAQVKQWIDEALRQNEAFLRGEALASSTVSRKRGSTFVASEDNSILDLLPKAVEDESLSAGEAELIRESVKLCRLFSLQPRATIPWEIHYNSRQRLLTWLGSGKFRIERRDASATSAGYDQALERTQIPEDMEFQVDAVEAGDWHIVLPNTFHHPVNDHDTEIWSTITFHQEPSRAIREALVAEGSFALCGDSVRELVVRGKKSVMRLASAHVPSVPHAVGFIFTALQSTLRFLVCSDWSPQSCST